ncbi:response regulator [Pseudodesulfovibrio sp.]|uniref:response regulator n=1 Tax=unclassified Pseudodesulfovibrio TaxID=2661612 RepID=UPI003B002E2A
MPDKKHVLVIDDDESFRELVRHHLEATGYTVSTAEDGPEGVKKFTETKFSAVLIDLYLPGMDGFAVVAELSSRSDVVPLIAASGASSLDNAIRAIRGGAWDFVTKGEGVLEELGEVLKKSLGRADYLTAQHYRLVHAMAERERFQEELSNQVSFLQGIIDAVPDPVFYKDLNGRYLGCNQAFESFMGMSREKVIGRKISEFLPAAEAAFYTEMDHTLLNSGSKVQTYERDRLIQGETRRIFVRKAVYSDTEGKKSGIVGVFSDLTPQVEYAETLRRNEERTRALLESSPLPLVIVEMETGRTIYANRRAAEQFRSSPDNAVGLKALWFYVDSEVRAEVMRLLHESGRVSDMEIEMRRTDGTRFWCQASAEIVKQNGDRLIFVSFTDITARKDLEEALRKFEFIANASHDMMTLSNRDHFYEAANRAYLEQMDKVGQDIVGHSVAEVWGEEIFSEHIEPNFLECLEGKPVTYQGWFAFPGKEKRFFEVFMYPYWGADGQVSHIAAVSRDITERKEAEDRLREALEQVEAIQDNAIFGVGLFIDDAVVRINQRGAEILGHIPEDMAGDHLSRYFLTQRKYRSFRSQCVHGLISTGSYHTEQQLRRADGALIWVQLSAKALDRKDLGQGVIWTILDITERRFGETVTRLLYQISSAVTTTSDLGELYERIHDSLGGAMEAGNFFIALLDKRRTHLEFTYLEDEKDDLRGALFNINDKRTTSLSVEVLRANRPLLVTSRALPERDRPSPSDGTDAICVVRDRFLAEHGVRDEDMLGTASQAWLGVPLRIKGEVIGVMSVQSYADPFQYSARDVGLMVSVSEQIALAIERKAIEQDLRHARDLAEAANQSKNEFLANMSHELRTPLNGVLGMLQLAQTTPLTEEQRDYVDTALTSGRSLLSIINDILDFSKMEAGKLEVVAETFSLSVLLQDVLSTFRGQMVGQKLALYSRTFGDIPDMLVGGKSRLRQILFNIVGNGIKFTEDGEVAVEVSLLHLDPRRRRLRLLFSVRDTGIGIPDHALHTIFEPFTQVDGSYMRRHQGTGLGLGIVKRLVDLMDGVLAVESEEGRGTTVYMALALGYEPSGTVEDVANNVSPSVSRRLRLLLVEDNRVNLLMGERMLAKLGHVVKTARNGEEALARLAEEEFDGVFMDIQMPGMNGLEATSRIRNASPDSGINPAIPVIAMTAHAMAGDREQFIESGMTDYIAKPVEMKDLESTLSKVFFPVA